MPPSAGLAFAHQDGQSPKPDPSNRSIVDGVFTLEQASRGRATFQQACASCHAMGDLAGRRFAAKWSPNTMGDLFELISTTMPEGAAGSLLPAEYASILALFLNESGYPEGERELSADPETLKKVRIEPLPQ
ncbi:MAG: c-type cytochrome [Acidobacteriota bacterium]